MEKAPEIKLWKHFSVRSFVFHHQQTFFLNFFETPSDLFDEPIFITVRLLFMIPCLLLLCGKLYTVKMCHK